MQFEPDVVVFSKAVKTDGNRFGQDWKGPGVHGRFAPVSSGECYERPLGITKGAKRLSNYFALP
ncbi:hypothetical protein BRD01_12205 [Halobacteriales archaeon QS_8_65_32]|nr:MAG: hypothetical protein BRD01_12205 [Halobacteriales archaeon QS_8_65_32]